MKILGLGALTIAAVAVIAILKPKRAKEGNKIEGMAHAHGTFGSLQTSWRFKGPW